MLPGLAPAIADNAKFASYLLQSNYFYDSGGSSHNHGNVQIGSPKAGDVLVFCFGNGTSGGQNFTGGTIGGQAITLLGQSAGANTRAAILYYVVPGGSALIGQATAELILTFAGGTTRSSGATYRLTNLQNTTPYDFDFPAGGGGGSSISATIDIPDGGIAIAFANGGEPLGSWTNAIADFNETATSSGWAGARAQGPATGLVINNNSCRCLGSASWS